MREHQDVDGAALTELLGPWPQATPPDAEVVAVTRCDGYTRERVEYDVEAGERVAAYVLVPSDVRPRAGVLCHHQHGNDFRLGNSEVAGLDGDRDQALGPELARRGYVVLAPDALGFEERSTTPSDREAAHRLLSGRTLLAKVLHDLKAAVGVLQDRSGAGQALGILGHSYGGRMATWVSAFDPRLAAAVSHCGSITYTDHLRLELPVQPEFVVPGITLWGDLGDVARLGKAPLLLSGTTDDRWSQSTAEVYEVARHDAPVELRLWAGGHVFTEPMRRAAYDFLERHLG